MAGRARARRRTYAPASRKVFARSMSHFGSRVPADSSSSTEASPPAPHLREAVSKANREGVGWVTHWMPTSGLGLRPCAAVNSMREAQSSVGMDRKPEDSSRTSNLEVAVPL